MEWQSAFSGGPVASACIGALGVGLIADRFGRKTAYAVALVVSYIGITLEVVAESNPVFFAGKFVKYGRTTHSFLFLTLTLEPAAFPSGVMPHFLLHILAR